MTLVVMASGFKHSVREDPSHIAAARNLALSDASVNYDDPSLCELIVLHIKSDGGADGREVRIDPYSIESIR